MSNESAACNCMGPQNGEPFCPCMMNRLGILKRNGRWVEPEKDLGPVIEPTTIDDIFRKKAIPFSKRETSMIPDIDDIVKKRTSMPFSKREPCTSVEHNPPTHLYVPPGEVYVHECPACGERSTITPPNITFSEIEDEDAFAAESDDEVLNVFKLSR